AGWAWRLTGQPLPDLADKLTEQIASVAGPVALFAIGLALIQFGFRSNFWQASATASVKLIFMPTVVLCVGLLVGLPPLVLQVAVASAALPSGANPYLIATHFGTGQGLASNAMTIGTAVSAGSVLLWLLMVQAIAPVS
ncbi:MAG: AEC family transporter, partial [Pseudomonadota bacterium]